LDRLAVDWADVKLLEADLTGRKPAEADPNAVEL